MSIYQASKDNGKVMGYRRAISSIKAYKDPITSASQMDDIPYVGEGIKIKVKQLLEQGKINKLE
jgi:DNA polymerase/3'-5' exonuclease PolX